MRLRSFFATLYHVSLSRWLCCKPELQQLFFDKNKLAVTHTGIFATQNNETIKRHKRLAQQRQITDTVFCQRHKRTLEKKHNAYQNFLDNFVLQKFKYALLTTYRTGAKLRCNVPARGLCF